MHFNNDNDHNNHCLRVLTCVYSGVVSTVGIKYKAPQERQGRQHTL